MVNIYETVSGESHASNILRDTIYAFYPVIGTLARPVALGRPAYMCLENGMFATDMQLTIIHFTMSPDELSSLCGPVFRRLQPAQECLCCRRHFGRSVHICTPPHCKERNNRDTHCFHELIVQLILLRPGAPPHNADCCVVSADVHCNCRVNHQAFDRSEHVQCDSPRRTDAIGRHPSPHHVHVHVDGALYHANRRILAQSSMTRGCFIFAN